METTKRPIWIEFWTKLNLACKYFAIELNRKINKMKNNEYLLLIPTYNYLHNMYLYMYYEIEEIGWHNSLCVISSLVMLMKPHCKYTTLQGAQWFFSLDMLTTGCPTSLERKVREFDLNQGNRLESLEICRFIIL